MEWDAQATPSAELYVIDSENRRRGDSWDKKDTRDTEHDAITRARIDKYFDFLQSQSEILVRFILDKEKRKLWIIGGSYAVFSLVTTVVVTVLTRLSKDLPTLLSLPNLMLFCLFIAAVVLIYTSIIKYVLAIKADCILATKQLNCLRQATNSVVFSYFHKKFPVPLEFGEDGKPVDTKGTILDRKMKYWNVYGRHNKYPIDNLSFREAYHNPDIYFRSADIYSVIIMAAFSSCLIATPYGFMYFHLASSKVPPNDSFLLGGISLAALILFLVLVKSSLSVAMERIQLYVDDGQPFRPRSKEKKKAT